jgi:hypothetical protein
MKEAFTGAAGGNDFIALAFFAADDSSTCSRAVIVPDGPSALRALFWWLVGLGVFLVHSRESGKGVSLP